MKFGTLLNDNKRLFKPLPFILDYCRLCNNLNLCEFGTVLI